MKKARKQFNDENKRPLPEGVMEWWKFCEANSSKLDSIPTFSEFLLNQSKNIDLN